MFALRLEEDLLAAKWDREALLKEKNQRQQSTERATGAGA